MNNLLKNWIKSAGALIASFLFIGVMTGTQHINHKVVPIIWGILVALSIFFFIKGFFK